MERFLRYTKNVNQKPFLTRIILGSYLLISLGLNACEKSQVPLPSSLDSSTTTASETQNSVRVGILVIDNAVSTYERYRPLLDYLEGVLGKTFELIPLTQDTQFTEVAQDNLDFILTNPLAAVQIRKLYEIKFLLTYSRPQTHTQFGGVIIVSQNSGIKTWEDLRGKRGACVDFETAAGGCIFQIYHLQQYGIDPHTDFQSFVENKSQDNIVLGVLNGNLDVGFIRTGQLEKMVQQGLINTIEEVQIFAPIEDNFFYPHTTVLYPEWPIATLKETDPKLVREVNDALLQISSDHQALKAAKVKAFVPAIDYQLLDELIEVLQLKGHNSEP